MAKKNFNNYEKLFGVKCWICRKGVRVRAKVHNHHIDGNRKNNVKSNQAWVCITCHNKVSKIQQKGRPLKNEKIQLTESRRSVCVRADEERPDAHIETTESITSSRVLRPLFKPYLIRRLVEGRPEVKDICRSFPKFVEKEYGLIGWGSDSGCYRYLGYECSSEGEFKIVTNQSGIRVVQFKNPENYAIFKDTKLPKNLNELGDLQ